MTVHFGARMVVTAQANGSILSSQDMREDVVKTTYWLANEAPPEDTVVITNEANAPAIAGMTDATVISYPVIESSGNKAALLARKKLRDICDLGEQGKVFAVVLNGEDKTVDAASDDATVRNVFEEAVLAARDGSAEVIKALD